jgi:alkanesulfonate monooxygenase SsuD/methylene tetrahydromethanopterin reductase-like flavin-dependent oxidoreductase (luciferase family)
MPNIQFGRIVPMTPRDGSDSSTFIEQIAQNLAAIQGHFHSAWLYDHFRPPFSFEAHDRGILESWTTICYLAAQFPNLHFGSLVLCQSYRNPALLAKMAATLQVLTHGRFILGLGAGHSEEEYRAYGYEFPKDSVRIGQLEEALQIIRTMWTESPASFDGRYYHVQDAYCEPKPNPYPPLLIGGGGEQLVLRAVARYADWWNLIFDDVETYAHKLAVLRAHCAVVGRESDEIVKTWAGGIAIAETEAEAQHMAKTSYLGQSPGTLINLIGTPDQVVEQLNAFRSLGVTYFILDFADFPDPSGAILFAKEVIPHFA